MCKYKMYESYMQSFLVSQGVLLIVDHVLETEGTQVQKTFAGQFLTAGLITLRFLTYIRRLRQSVPEARNVENELKPAWDHLSEKSIRRSKEMRLGDQVYISSSVPYILL